MAEDSIVSSSAPSVRCRKKVPDRYHESKEARYPVTSIHGSSEGPTIDDGCCE